MRKLPLLLLVFVLGSSASLHGQSFDLTSGRVPVASIDGFWRFHTGDDPAWSDPNFDDSQWPLLRSDTDWDSQGYPGYAGLAWYRFQVSAPASLGNISLLLPPPLTCFEVFANGTLIGSYGKMPPNTYPFGGGNGDAIYPLPARKQGQDKLIIAIRIWHWPGWTKYYGGGPLHGGGLVGDSRRLQQHFDFEEGHHFWMFNDIYTQILLDLVAGLAALALFLLRRKEPEYLWFSLIILMDALSASLTFYTVNHVINVELRDALEAIATCAGGFASIAFYRVLFQPKRSWLLKLAILSIVLNFAEALFEALSGSVLGVSFDAFVQAFLLLLLNAWIIDVVLAAVRRKSPDARLLVAPVLVMTANTLLASIAWATFAAGWQHNFDGSVMLTATPFPIALSDAVWALFLLSVFAILILRFTRTRSEEERFAKELQSARDIQQYLIPSQLPPTPGLRIESEYRPAREVGGDFFQILPHPEDGSVLIVLGDVAGKGLQAGMLATLIVGAIRTAAAFTRDPARIMALLNDRLQGRGLVTCLALNIQKDGNAVLVNAGHLPPYLNQAELPIEGSLPLGATPFVDFPVFDFRLAPDDSLMLMSDGIAEAQDAKGHLFGFERIAALLHESASAARLATAAQEFGQEDDITVLTMARTVVSDASALRLVPE